MPATPRVVMPKMNLVDFQAIPRVRRVNEGRNEGGGGADAKGRERGVERRAGAERPLKRFPNVFIFDMRR